MSPNQQPRAIPHPGPTIGVEWGGRGAAIVVPLDGALESKTALPVARLIAKITGAAIRVVYAVDKVRPRKELLGELKLARREETVGLIIDQVVGVTAEAIARKAAEQRAMLVVMTTRGASPYEGRALRPVPEHVVQTAPCPVMLVRPEIAQRVARTEEIRRILLPLDGSPAAMSTVSPVVNLADRSGAELDVLYVAQLYARAAQEPGTISTPRYVDQPHYEWPAWAQECLDRFYVAVGESPTVAPTRVFMRSGQPSEEILSFATEHDNDLIVLEWRGRFDQAHHNVVTEVLAKSPCPVLLLRTLPSASTS